MCGIAGSFGRLRPDETSVALAMGSLRHRGPDASGVFRARVGPNELCLMHTRLSIIDLDARANQPFEKDGFVIVFNGEIYNFLELRAELEAAGHRFTTSSDTEVIVEAYRRYGAACTERFEGMWALVLFDRATGRLWFSRDRFGEKPLFLRWHRGTLYFASEVKALAALSGDGLAPDIDHIRRYLVLGYKSLFKGAATFYREIVELPAACSAVLDTPSRLHPERYWSLDYRPRVMSMDDAVAGVRERLTRALKLRLRADVPLAFCLSGGIDSATLTALAAREYRQPIAAFSIIDSDPRYDESASIELMVSHLGCRHEIVRTRTDGFLDRLQAQVAAHDAPVATISYYVHAFLSEAIARQGFKVAISGTGADELFTGYYDHYNFWLAERAGDADFENLVADWRAGYGATVRNPFLGNPRVFVDTPMLRDHIFLDAERFASFLVEPFTEGFSEAHYSDNVLRNRMLNELLHESVPVILREDDLNSMGVSIENRSPFLDRALAEFLYEIPNRHLIGNGCAKWLLRAAGEGLVPDAIRLDRRKRGFNASIDSLLDRRNPQVIDRLLAPGPIFDIVRRSAIEQFLKQDLTDNSLSKFMFSFASAKLFLETPLASGRSMANAA